MIRLARFEVKLAPRNYVRDQLGRFARTAGSTRSPGIAGGFRRFGSDDDGDRWAKENMPVPAMSPGERKAVTSYTGDWFDEMNAEMRQPNSQQASIRRWARQLQDVLGRCSCPEPIVVYRGQMPKQLAGKLGVDFDRPEQVAGLVGRVYEPKGFQSTSIGVSTPFYHALVQWQIRVPAGSPALYLNRPGLTSPDFSEEREVLLGAGMGRLIHAIYRNPDDTSDKRWYVEAELVPAGFTPGPGWVPRPYGDAHLGYEQYKRPVKTLSPVDTPDPVRTTPMNPARLEQILARHLSEDDGATVAAGRSFPDPVGAVTAAQVTTRDGLIAGLVWTDDHAGAGWLAAPLGGPAQTAAAGGFGLARRGERDRDTTGELTIGEAQQFAGIEDAYRQLCPDQDRS